ncbi:hypothetical protein BV378_27790 [Nostoc sp. RF31YmG]|nr:hypothetical protein BV378_27790 [Nostoc sp. RF31YmG]
MLGKDCRHDCNSSSCPFAQDTRNPDRYVCLKCGVERDINQYSSGIRFFWLLILALLIAFQLLANGEKQNDQKQQKQKSGSNSLHQVISYQQ